MNLLSTPEKDNIMSTYHSGGEGFILEDGTAQKEKAAIDKLFSFLRPEHRVMIFIDGANAYTTARSLTFDIDYSKLYDIFQQRCDLIRAFYFTALNDNYEEYHPARPLTDWLTYNKYHLVSKPSKQFTDEDGRKRTKGNMDVDIAIAMMNAVKLNIDYAILVSGDGDFKPLVEHCQLNSTMKVAVISSLRGDHPFIADELRRQADNFVDLQDLAPYVRRYPKNNQPTHRRMTYTRGPLVNDDDQPLLD
jgi:uncharacterized LabA/DUF88 family protein